MVHARTARPLRPSALPGPSFRPEPPPAGDSRTSVPRAAPPRGAPRRTPENHAVRDASPHAPAYESHEPAASPPHSCSKPLASVPIPLPRPPRPPSYPCHQCHRTPPNCSEPRARATNQRPHNSCPSSTTSSEPPPSSRSRTSGPATPSPPPPSSTKHSCASPGHAKSPGRTVGTITPPRPKPCAASSSTTLASASATPDAPRH